MVRQHHGTQLKAEGEKMGGKCEWNSIFKRTFCFLGVGAVVFGLAAASLSVAAPVDRPAQTDQNRPVDKALPAPGMYTIDAAHSFAYFGARHHVVGLVRGRFDKVTGTITVAKDLAACAVDVSIDVSSLNTQNTERDDDLRSPSYFDVKKFPAMTYQGRGIRRVSESSWVMDGSLTMHGVTKMVPLTFNFNGVFSDTKPGEPARAAFHGSTGVKRAEFGMGARDNLDELGMLTTPDVAIEIDVEADASSPTK
jgi:polyisoprenoid-binding protein YceI